MLIFNGSQIHEIINTIINNNVISKFLKKNMLLQIVYINNKLVRTAPYLTLDH